MNFIFLIYKVIIGMIIYKVIIGMTIYKVIIGMTIDKSKNTMPYPDTCFKIINSDFSFHRLLAHTITYNNIIITKP